MVIPGLGDALQGMHITTASEGPPQGTFDSRILGIEIDIDRDDGNHFHEFASRSLFYDGNHFHFS